MNVKVNKRIQSLKRLKSPNLCQAVATRVCQLGPATNSSLKQPENLLIPLRIFTLGLASRITISRYFWRRMKGWLIGTTYTRKHRDVHCKVTR